MTNKINFDNYMKSFTGVSPSNSYYNTTERFQTILTDKLGRVSQTGTSNNSETSTVKTSGLSSGIDFDNLTLKSNASASEIDAKLAGTEMAGLGSAFVNAEEKYGVNAWFLAGLAAHESAYGTSRIAQSKQNLFGFGAYDNSPYSSAKAYASFEEGVDAVAKYLKANYLSEDGKYYNGTSIESVNKRYATDQNWANAIMSHISQMIEG